MPDSAANADWLEQVERTEGWLSLEEARELHALAAGVERGAIIEVGAYRGRSTIALSAGAREGVPMFSVEPHELVLRDGRPHFGPEDRAAFYEAMIRSGAYRNVRLLNTSSEIVTPGWKRPVGLLWIDGDHRLEGVTRDWECWRPHLAAAAVVAFDDAHNRAVGPHYLIERLLGEGALVHRRSVGKVATFTLGARG